MPAAKLYVELFASGTSVPAGTLKSAPVVSTVAPDIGTVYGGELTWRITNGGALGAGCVIEFQASHNGSDWYEYQKVTVNDLLSGTVSEGPTIPLGRSVMRIRAIAYGNTTSACTIQAGVMLLTGL